MSKADRSFWRRERDRRIRKLYGDALLSPAEDRVAVVEAFPGGATGARMPLIAPPGIGCSARKWRMQYVAANWPVADLRRRRQDRKDWAGPCDATEFSLYFGSYCRNRLAFLGTGIFVTSLRRSRAIPNFTAASCTIDRS